MIRVRTKHSGECDETTECPQCVRLDKLMPTINNLVNDCIVGMLTRQEFSDLKPSKQFETMKVCGIAALTLAIEAIDHLELRLRACADILETIDDTFAFHCDVGHYDKTH